MSYRVRITWQDGHETVTRFVSTKGEAKALASTFGDLGLIVAVAIETLAEKRKAA